MCWLPPSSVRSVAHNIFGGSYFVAGEWHGRFSILSITAATLLAALPIAFRLRTLYQGAPLSSSIPGSPSVRSRCSSSHPCSRQRHHRGQDESGNGHAVVGHRRRAGHSAGPARFSAKLSTDRASVAAAVRGKIVVHDAWLFGERDRYTTFIVFGAALTLVSRCTAGIARPSGGFYDTSSVLAWSPGRGRGRALFRPAPGSRDAVSPNAVVDVAADRQHDLSRVPMHVTRLSDADEIRIGRNLARHTGIRAPDRDDVDIRTTSTGSARGSDPCAAQRFLLFFLDANPDLTNALALPGGHVVVGLRPYPADAQRG